MLGQVWFIIIFVFNTENLGNGSALIWCIFGAHTEDKGGWTMDMVLQKSL